MNKNKAKINYNEVYVGKEDFEEENELINDLKENKYKDIIDLNKDKYYNCHDKYNITCMLIKLFDKKYPDIEIKEIEKGEMKGNNNNKKDESSKIENNIQQINKEKEKKDEINKENEIKKEEKKEIKENKINKDKEYKNIDKKEENEKNNKEN